MSEAVDFLDNGELDFLDSYEGQGLDAFGAKDVAAAFLGLVQPGSKHESASCKPGTWRNTASGRNFGNMVKVVPLAFKTIWSERESEAPYRTVARYEPHSIKVDTRTVKGKAYPKMYNPETGNEVQELYIYAVVLPDYPEEGILYCNPTVGGMRACRAWNTQIKSALLPSGKSAPIFGFQWLLVADCVTNPQRPSEQIAQFIKAERDSVVSKDLFMQSIKSNIEAAQAAVVQATTLGIEAPADET